MKIVQIQQANHTNKIIYSCLASERMQLVFAEKSSDESERFSYALDIQVNKGQIHAIWISPQKPIFRNMVGVNGVAAE